MSSKRRRASFEALAFHGPGWRAFPASPTVAAAIYPQAVALTRLLVSPYWQALSSGLADPQGLFIVEVHRTVAPGYLWPQPYRPADPLDSWIRERYVVGHRPAPFCYRKWPVPEAIEV